ncbi:MAG: protein kinase [Myxococcales bacterium]|nr:protein kinase [Myxococcales bacterium]
MKRERGILGWLFGGSGNAAQPHVQPTSGETRARVDGEGPKADLLERFESRGEIGRGGMATVYHVVDRNLLRHSAMKVLAPELARQGSFRLRFLEEAQIGGQLDHPNIVPVHELGVDDAGALYFTMKLVVGETLESWLFRDVGPRSVQMVAPYLDVLVKVCDAISFAHSRGVVHRDLKPANIMIGSYGQVYVMDWGLARIINARNSGGSSGRARRPIATTRDRDNVELDEEGMVAGSISYMPPEQAKAQNHLVDERSDVFTLGAVLYHVITGRAPFAGDDLRERVLRAQAAKFTPVEEMELAHPLPQRLGAIAERAMAYDPEERYQSAEALKQDLLNYQRGAIDLPLRTYPPGGIVVKQGDVGDEAYMIKFGTCRAWKEVGGERIELGILSQGDVFGETAVLASKPRTATVEAVDEVTVAVVDADTLNEGVVLNNWLGPFVRALAQRYVQLDQRFEQAVSSKR